MAREHYRWSIFCWTFLFQRVGDSSADEGELRVPNTVGAGPHHSTRIWEMALSAVERNAQLHTSSYKHRSSPSLWRTYTEINDWWVNHFYNGITVSLSFIPSSSVGVNFMTLSVNQLWCQLSRLGDIVHIKGSTEHFHKRRRMYVEFRKIVVPAFSSRFRGHPILHYFQRDSLN